MKQKLKHNLNKYVENSKLEQGLYKVSDKIRDKKGKDYSKYVSKIMNFIRKKCDDIGSGCIITN
ncbi:hypothetical protein [Staphylococcus saprophyticus]|uniref:hypothetical protein n=1 Tax=Staphylococcus saprophyticus TaxID=29385 RepID=UPI000DFA3080|nr:hypothetical protein [Staphylococcus saprophyticus]MEB6414713.1 hypothetical protein [Staphylococcus saprophyticus]SUM91510.1 Uncharacterised protein [Staphylococcus saprophyticus]